MWINVCVFVFSSAGKQMYISNKYARYSSSARQRWTFYDLFLTFSHKIHTHTLVNYAHENLNITVKFGPPKGLELCFSADIVFWQEAKKFLLISINHFSTRLPWPNVFIWIDLRDRPILCFFFFFWCGFVLLNQPTLLWSRGAGCGWKPLHRNILRRY